MAAYLVFRIILIPLALAVLFCIQTRTGSSCMDGTIIPIAIMNNTYFAHLYIANPVRNLVVAARFKTGDTSRYI
jgi:hypothetical protein